MFDFIDVDILMSGMALLGFTFCLMIGFVVMCWLVWHVAQWCFMRVEESYHIYDFLRHRAEFMEWSEVKDALEDNPDLPYSFVLEALEAKKDKPIPYERKTEPQKYH